jgi:hypothetical protein
MPRPFPDPDKELEALTAFLTKGGETTLEVIKTFKATETVGASLDKPGTVLFDATASGLLEQIGDDADQRVLIDLGIGDLTAATGYFVHLFLNTRDATADTSDDVPGFEAGFSFFCEPAQDMPEMACPIGDRVTTTRFDVTATLKEIAGPNDAITATLVLVPAAEDGAKEAALSVKAAELSLVKSIVKIAS